ncbi:hypothetical protein GMMP15_1130008 [Candidatus Magnetomoraceae bacterium gMMP-15]
MNAIRRKKSCNNLIFNLDNQEIEKELWRGFGIRNIKFFEFNLK